MVLFFTPHRRKINYKELVLIEHFTYIQYLSEDLHQEFKIKTSFRSNT